MPGKANAYALVGVKTDTVIVENNEISEKERKEGKMEGKKERRKWDAHSTQKSYFSVSSKKEVSVL